jgi:hypothetical protein
MSDAHEGIHVVACEERDIDDIAIRPPKGTVVRIMRGSRCDTKAHMFQEWAAAFQFPGHFGNNWDAFEDCVNDLGWLPGTHAIAIVTRADKILPRSAKDFSMLLSILLAAQGAMGLRVVMQCEPGRQDILRNRISKLLNRS